MSDFSTLRESRKKRRPRVLPPGEFIPSWGVGCQGRSKWSDFFPGGLGLPLVEHKGDIIRLL